MNRRIPPVTLNLLIINAIIFVAINVLNSRMGDAIIDLGALHYFSSELFRPTQLFTYMFMHEDFMHLFFNMFALWMFGTVIERTMGGARFLFYYISCGLGAALIQEGVFAIMAHHYAQVIVTEYGQEAMNMVVREGADIMANGQNYADYYLGAYNSLVNSPAIGASGAIYGVLLAFGFLYPRQPIYLMFIPIPIQARWMVIGYGAIELLQGLSNNPSDNVAHFCHLGGMLAGLLILLYWRHRFKHS